MRMTMGRKIGCGFAVIILLSLILSMLTARAMRDIQDLSRTIERERVPQLQAIMGMQRSLLLAGLNTTEYYTSLNGKAWDLAENNLKDFETAFNAWKACEAASPSDEGAAFLRTALPLLEQYRAERKTYGDLVMQSFDIVELASSLHGEIRDTLDEMIRQLGEDERALLQCGEVSTALELSRLLTDVSDARGRMTTVIEQLLQAVTQKDDTFLASIMEEGFPEAVRSLEALTPRLPEKIRSLQETLLQTLGDVRSHAEQLTNVRRSMTASEKKRLESFYGAFNASSKLADAVSAGTSAAVQDAASVIDGSITLVTLASLGMLALGVVLAVVIAGTLSRPLRRTQEFARAVAEGDLDRTLDVHGNDETGVLADVLRHMVASLKDALGDAKRQSEEARRQGEQATQAMQEARDAQAQAERAKREGMLAAAGQLASAVDVISGAVSDLGSRIEDSNKAATDSAQRLSSAAAAINEMNATVQEVAKNASDAANMSSETRQKAEQGASIVQSSLDSIEAVRSDALTLKEDMAQLNQHAQDISNIMGVISDIADQTNLLALNAAIEAARAGEAGRGFAVVADEVRKLAEKTMASTQDVSKAIQAIQESAAKSVGSMDRTVERVEQATTFAQQSGDALREIVTDAESTADEVRAIATASEEQSAASEEINRSVLGVSSISDESAKAMSEAAQSVAELNRQAQNLKTLIEQMQRS